MYFLKIILTIFTFISNILNAEVILLDNTTDNQVIGDTLKEKHNNDDNNKENENNNQNKFNQTKTLIKFDVNLQCPKSFDQNILNNNENIVVKKVNAITYFPFGTEGKPVIDIYISPSCLHCAHFVINDLDKFLEKHKNECFVRVMLIPFIARDFFIMKIMQAEARDSSGYRMIFSNYMKRAIATIDNIHPTNEQKALYKGSNTDPDMIKYQVIAKEFGFTDEKIVKAIPNMDEEYEQAVMEYYKNTLNTISDILKQDKSKPREIEVPLIICNGKSYKTLEKAFDACNRN